MKVSPLAKVLTLFLVILVARFEIIDSPPFYDFAIGIWREAVYLARNNFDYWKLRYDEGHGLEPAGGPRSYLTTIVPGALAVLFRVLPGHTAPIVVYHLLVFAAASVVIAFTYRVLQRSMGGMSAALLVGAMATTPVFCVQIDMLGFEILLAMFACLCLWSLSENRYLASVLWAFGAFLIKPTGVLLSASVAVYLTTRGVGELVLHRRWHPRIAVSLGLQVLILGAQALILWWGGSVDEQMGGRLQLAIAWAWFPDVLIIAIVALVMAIWLTTHWVRHEIASAPTFASAIARPVQSMARFIVDQPAFCLSLVFLILLAAATMRVRFVPRYAAVGVPFLYVVIAFLATRLGLSRALIGALASLMIAVNLYNWNGALYPSMTWSLDRLSDVPGEALAREGSLLERSHEYLAQHRANLEALHSAVAGAGEQPIVCGFPHTAYLAFPELGVVASPPTIYSTMPFNDPATGVREATELSGAEAMELVAIHDRNAWYLVFSQWEIPAYQGETVLFSEEPDAYLLVTGKRFADQAAFDAWIARGAAFPQRAALNLFMGERSAGPLGLIALAQQQIKENPALRVEMEAICAAGLAIAGQWRASYDQLLNAQATHPFFERALDRGRQRSSPMRSDGLEQLMGELRNLDLSGAAAASVVLCAAELPFLKSLLGEYRAGIARLEEGDVAPAQESFQRCLAMQADFFPAILGLARARVLANELETAEGLTRRVLKSFPSSHEAQRLLALILSAQGSASEARDVLSDAVQNGDWPLGMRYWHELSGGKP